MKDLGALVSDPQFALQFRVIEPAPAEPEALLVLLHGVGGNETNLAAVGAEAPPGTLVVLPRGRLALGPQQFAWFRVAFSAAGPQIVASEAEDSRTILIRLIRQLQNRYDVDARHTTIAGFSQGGILSASVALSAPESVHAFAVLAGRILPELEPAIASRERLASLRAFVAHGRFDDKLPVAWAERADAWLTQLGVAHETRLYSTGHELDAAMLRDFLHWLAQPIRDVTAVLHMDAEQTTLSAKGAAVHLAPGWARVARDYFTRWPPGAGEIENAIAAIEDELMRAPRSWHGVQLRSDAPVLREIARAAGVPDTAQLSREVVERTFERLAAVALGRPNAREQLPEDVGFAAALVVLRELIHHLDIAAIALAEVPQHGQSVASQ